MVAAPVWLSLQVSRFDARGNKVTAPISVSDAVYVPCFRGESLQTTSHRYKLVAIIYHLGASAHTGHCRSAFCQDGDIMFVTEDGKQASEATSADVQQVQANAYIFLLRKC